MVKNRYFNYVYCFKGSTDIREYVRSRIATHKIDWNHILYTYTVSEEFIREFKDYLDWETVSHTQTLSIEFIREFKDRIHWHNLSFSRRSMTYDICREFRHELDWYMMHYETMSTEFILEMKEYVDWGKVYSRNIHRIDFASKFIK